MRTERSLARGSRRSRTLIAAAIAIALLAWLSSTGPVGIDPANAQDSSSVSSAPTVTDEPIEAMVPLPAGPGDDGVVHLDTSLYLPTSVPRRWCCSRTDSAGRRRTSTGRRTTLRDLGYVVLTYSARGFGRSDGKISLDSVDHEVADASGLIDYAVEQASSARMVPAIRRWRSSAGPTAALWP